MSNYEKIQYLLQKYSTKQPQERWSPKSEIQYMKLLRLNEKIKLFDGINSEFFNLTGSQKERVIYLIKRLDFKKICGQCSNEQIIVLICYFVKCEYVNGYGRHKCRRVFREYEISDNLIDKFMVYLAHCGVNGGFS